MNKKNIKITNYFSDNKKHLKSGTSILKEELSIKLERSLYSLKSKQKIDFAKSIFLGFFFTKGNRYVVGENEIIYSFIYKTEAIFLSKILSIVLEIEKEKIRIDKDKNKYIIKIQIGENLFIEKINRIYREKELLESIQILKGIILFGGNYVNPKINYQLEIYFTERIYLNEVCEIFSDFDIPVKVFDKEKTHKIYFKSGEVISEVLALVGAIKTVLELENIKVYKNESQNLNRTINLEVANMNKTLLASKNQIEDILKIEKTGIILEDTLKDVAKVRVEHPESSYSELAKMIGIHKSTFVQRLNKIKKIAEDI